MANNSSLSKIQDDIDKLQTMERELLVTLETSANLTLDQKKSLNEKINKITGIRIRLYQTISGASGMYKGILDDSRDKLSVQTDAIKIMETELNNTKARIAALKDDKNNKLRMVQVNDYYGSMYSEQSDLMKIIIFTLIPIIILVVLRQRMLLLFLPEIVYNIILVAISITGGVFFVLKAGNYMTRDNMNYQEFDWVFNKKNAPKSSGEASTDPWSSPFSGIGTCVGAQCCLEDDTQMYDDVDMKCKPKSDVITPLDDTVVDETMMDDTTENFTPFSEPAKYMFLENL
jgi:prefoldin subunit 5